MTISDNISLWGGISFKLAFISTIFTFMSFFLISLNSHKFYETHKDWDNFDKKIKEIDQGIIFF